MKTHRKKSIFIIQSGGPTAVVNQSLAGLVQEACKYKVFGSIYGGVHGISGLLDGNFLDLLNQPTQTWSKISQSPGAALGTSRRNLAYEEAPRALEQLDRLGVGFLFTIGGNDTAETAHFIAEHAARANADITVIHIPKTIDNDLMGTDHSPGFGSAARFVAMATMGAGKDAEAMGAACPITVMEVMGRDAGWLAASSILGKVSSIDAPHFIVIPEVPFDQDQYLSRIEEAYQRWGYAVAITAENSRSANHLINNEASPYYVDDFGHEYYEGPARHIAEITSKALHVRTRFEKPGTIQRSMANCVSKTDAEEAYLVGKSALIYAIEGHTDKMVTLSRRPGTVYGCDTGLTPLTKVCGKVRTLPTEFFDARLGLPTQDYVKYALPLIGRKLPTYARLS